jgi:surface antigen
VQNRHCFRAECPDFFGCRSRHALLRTLCVLVAVAFLTACASGEDPGYGGGNGMSGAGLGGMGRGQTVGTLGGAAAGALLGSQFGKGNGRLLGAAAGALAGGFLGNRLGARLDERDAQRDSVAERDAIEMNRPVSWRNDDTGNMGAVVPRDTFSDPAGRTCRQHEHSVVVEGRRETGLGTACRNPDGNWVVVDEG